MKKLYLLIFLISFVSLNAQTTVPYTQQVANYDSFYFDNGGNFDNGIDQFGMWANGADPKESVAWRSFTEDGTTTGTASTMAVGDSFTITVSAAQAAYGVIGLALLSSPTAKVSWADRINNYAVQVNLNGNGGASDPWEVVSTGGTVDASSISGSQTRADFKFTFTLDTATSMTVSINDGAWTANVTLNNQNITGYSVYIKDDWSEIANENIYWKPLSEYTYAIPLNIEEFDSNFDVTPYPNPVSDSFTINSNLKALNIYDITGKLVSKFRGSFKMGESYNISNLKKGIYLIELENEVGQKSSSKLIKL